MKGDSGLNVVPKALAAASFGDTIYVQSGVYLESTLILINGVNWFCTVGTSYLFSDGGANVNSTIEGYGRFISSGGILNITSASNINFNGIFVDISGTVPGFVVSGDSELTLSVDEIVSDTSTVLQITGDTKINWESQTIDTLGSIIVIDSPASGSGNFIVRNTVGDPSVDSNGGLFYNNSEFFGLNDNISATVTNGNNTSIYV